MPFQSFTVPVSPCRTSPPVTAEEQPSCQSPCLYRNRLVPTNITDGAQTQSPRPHLSAPLHTWPPAPSAPAQGSPPRQPTAKSPPPGAGRRRQLPPGSAASLQLPPPPPRLRAAPPPAPGAAAGRGASPPGGAGSPGARAALEEKKAWSASLRLLFIYGELGFDARFGVTVPGRAGEHPLWLVDVRHRAGCCKAASLCPARGPRAPLRLSTSSLASACGSPPPMSTPTRMV